MVSLIPSKKEKSVTILVTLKNSAATIKQCIESLLKQTYKNYEIFVVDAYSTDGSYEILKGFGRKIRLYQLRGWASKAYNWAIRRIKTDYIALIDSDCIADKNWLKELVSGFTLEDILAVAGYCGTPRNASKLQKLIGKELESRFKEFPKYISRAPTMNLCFKTDIARKLRFDETLRVGYDTDFGYRLTKLGKMLYNKKAIIYHYHRATWKNFFKQQFRTATYVPKLYLKHKSKIRGDSISTRMMMFQIIMFFSSFIVGVITIFFPISPIYLETFLIILFLSYIKVLKLSGSISDFFWIFLILIVRTIAWGTGLVVGIFKLIKK
jgi:glycosyltransferase involved in cell wall biosynthesis